MHSRVTIKEPKPRELPAPRSPVKVSTYFHQECPACGRQLQVPIEQFGQQLICRHCGSRLNAVDSLRDGQDSSSSLQRADQLLAKCSTDDAELRQRVLRYLRTRGIEDLENIHVGVDRAVVILQGRVTSPHLRWLCVNCARRVAGVIRVIDRLEIGKRESTRRGGC